MKRALRVLLLAFGVLAPGAAFAAGTAVATADLNMRAGPSTRYPTVDVIWEGDTVRVQGCLADRAWCDVSYRGVRGWASAAYLAEAYRGRRYTYRSFPTWQVPVISFSFGSYWHDHYRYRDFYHWRDRYEDRRHRRVHRRYRHERRAPLPPAPLPHVIR